MGMYARALCAAVAVVGSFTTLAAAVPFELLVTETPTGPVPTDPAQWGGVQRWTFTGTGAAAVAGTGIPAASLSDPAGLSYDNVSNTLFVGNRHANVANSSITAFEHDPFGAFTNPVTSTGNSLYGVHQLALNPTQNELFAANVNSPVSRFTNTNGTLANNGIIPITQPTRGVAVSDSGDRLFISTASNIIRLWDLNTNTDDGTFTVTGASSLHYMRIRNGNELYAADFINGAAGKVWRLAIDANDDLSIVGSFDVPGAIGLDFSPDGNEMYVAGHNNGNIYRFLYNSNTNAWDANGLIDTPFVSLGDLIVIPSESRDIPEPASLGILALGAVGLLARRKR